MVILKRILSAIDRTERNKINENYDAIESEFTRLNRDITQFPAMSEEIKLTATEAKNTATDALSVANSIDAKAIQAISTASTAINTANAAKTIAEGIDGKATNALQTAADANKNSNDAVEIAVEAETLAETVRNQFHEVIAEAGSNNPEVVASRIDTESGEQFVSLPDRLDKQHKQVTTQLAQIGQYVLQPNVVGLEWDFVSDTYKRLGKAVGLTGGGNFNQFNSFGGRRRCNLADDGTVLTYYGDPNYKEDGTNGQVMVEQPRFWYKVEFTERVIRWWVSDIELSGFKIHPTFIVDGVALDKVYTSAFEGSIFDVSANAYLLDDEQVADFTTSTGDKLCSIANAKPSSGLTQNLTIVNSRILANNRGDGWGLHDFAMASASQLLMLIEYATFNMQTAVGLGVVNKASGAGNESEKTGQSSSFGNSSGNSGANGVSSITYRGEENFWGNIWTWLDGLNIQNNVPYINTTNKDFVSDKFDANYKTFGFSLPNVNGYQKELQTTNNFDYGFLPKSVRASSTTFVTDNYYQGTGNRVALLGGYWADSLYAGARFLHLHSSSGSRVRNLGARLSFRKK